jgi:hypothetical protein
LSRLFQDERVCHRQAGITDRGRAVALIRDGTGLGASHQTGWTGLVAELLGRDAQVEEDQ